MSASMGKEAERPFLEKVGEYLLSLPFDLKILQEAVTDPDLDRGAREIAAGTIIHTIGPQEGDGPMRFVDDVLLVRAAFKRVVADGGDARQGRSPRASTARSYGKLDDDLRDVRRGARRSVAVAHRQARELPQAALQGQDPVAVRRRRRGRRRSSTKRGSSSRPTTTSPKTKCAIRFAASMPSSSRSTSGAPKTPKRRPSMRKLGLSDPPRRWLRQQLDHAAIGRRGLRHRQRLRHHRRRRQRLLAVRRQHQRSRGRHVVHISPSEVNCLAVAGQRLRRREEVPRRRRHTRDVQRQRHELQRQHLAAVQRAPPAPPATTKASRPSTARRTARCASPTTATPTAATAPARACRRRCRRRHARRELRADLQRRHPRAHRLHARRRVVQSVGRPRTAAATAPPAARARSATRRCAATAACSSAAPTDRRRATTAARDNLGCFAGVSNNAFGCAAGNDVRSEHLQRHLPGHQAHVLQQGPDADGRLRRGRLRHLQSQRRRLLRHLSARRYVRYRSTRMISPRWRPRKRWPTSSMRASSVT